MLYCLGNNDKDKSLYIFSTDISFPNIFNQWLSESMDGKPTDMKGQLYNI
jgi:hypothetical protein